MNNLTLAEYRAHPEATFPAQFGGQVVYHDPNAPEVPSSAADVAVSEFSAHINVSPCSSQSTDYNNISRYSCIFQISRVN